MTVCRIATLETFFFAIHADAKELRISLLTSQYQVILHVLFSFLSQAFLKF